MGRGLHTKGRCSTDAHSSILLRASKVLSILTPSCTLKPYQFTTTTSCRPKWQPLSEHAEVPKSAQHKIDANNAKKIYFGTFRFITSDCCGVPKRSDAKLKLKALSYVRFRELQNIFSMSPNVTGLVRIDAHHSHITLLQCGARSKISNGRPLPPLWRRGSVTT